MSDLPLEGIRILELAQNVAAPLATRLLAVMGADVIKVESASRLDPVRNVWYAENDPSGAYWNKGGYGHEVNTGKVGVALDLNTPAGREVVKDLIRQSDVLVENFTPRVMAKWGLTYDVLKGINPTLIMVSNTGYGNGGPWESYKAMGMHLEGTTGLSFLTGYRDGPPMRTGIAYTDTPTAYMAAFAILSALAYRRRAGKGQWIQVSMYEVGVSILVEAMMDYFLNQRTPARMGNENPSMAPHGAYRCKGKDQWITIAVASDQEWHSLCRVMEMTGLAGDPRFADCLSRWQHRRELDPIIEQWTSQRDRDEIARALQAAGVAAGGVLTNRDILFDPHMKERGFFGKVTFTGETQEVGSRVVAGRPWLMAETDLRLRRPAPGLGQHTADVLRELLGMSDAQLADLEKGGVTAKVPKGRSPHHVLNVEEQVAQGAAIEYDPDYKRKLGI